MISLLQYRWFRYTLLAGTCLLALLALGLFIRVRFGGGAKAPLSPAGAVLPQDDREQILVDPVHHSLIIVKPTGNQTLTLPDHPSVIDIKKDGSVSVTSPQHGLEHTFFFGVHASDKFRLAAGVDAYYYKKLDLGIGIADAIGFQMPIVFGQVSYTVYDNCRLGIAYGSNRYIGGTLTVRL